MDRQSHTISINPLVESFYDMAAAYDGIDSAEINPSYHELSQVAQRYQKPELFAEGGMKRIYKVYDARARRYLAMAMLRENATEDLFDPFIHEAWLTAQLDHPNIITIHDVGLTRGGQPYFTMDLKQGDTLMSLLDKLHQGHRKTQNQYSLAALLQIFLTVCDAVSYAHSVNVLHLDLKPANIQIGKYGRVLVCDWGLGRVLGGKGPQELDRMLFNPDLLGSTNLYGQFKGTPGYMAPEQLADDGNVDARTDVYGLGCILYSLLTLLRPLTSKDEEIIRRTKDGSIVEPIKRAPGRDIPEGLNAVVMKALSTDPSKRYASVDALRSEVHRYLTGFATEAENAGVFKQLALFYRRSRRFCLMVLSFVLLGISGAGWSFWELSKKERIATEARHSAESTLALYEAGKSELEKVSHDNIQSIVEVSRQLMVGGNILKAQAVLKVALQEHPGNALLLRAMGETFFCMQGFNKALEWLEQGVGRADDPLLQLARTYAAIKPDEKALGAAQVVDVLTRFEGSPACALSLVLMDQKRRGNLEERAEIVAAFLRKMNPEWMDGWFEYDVDQASLRVGGGGLRLLSFSESVLAGLYLRNLEINGSGVNDLWNEQVLVLERLDIRGSPFTGLWFVVRMVHLKELVIEPGQFPDGALEKLPERVKVITRPWPEG